MDINIRITTSCFFLLLSFCCIFHCTNANNDGLKPAVVVGTVYCNEACVDGKSSKFSHLISAASVFVECENFKKEAKTNRRGVFRIRLPPKTSPKSCSLSLIKSSNPSCSIASSTMKKLRLKSKRKGLYVYTTGSLSFRPEKCNENQKQVVQPDFFFFPPIPFLPSPGLPLPPNPLVPPPSLIPPIIPSPPPSVLPPIFPSPPPSLIPPIIPGLPVPLPFLAPPPPPPPSLLPPIIPGVPIPFPPLLPGNPPHSP